MARKKMTEKDKRDWESLYNYVKYKIMGYDEVQALSNVMVLRLKGLLTNKFIENNNIENTANYSYEVILNTFKYCSPDIQKALRNNNWADEMHKFNYILKIVEKNINTVYVKMKNIKKVEDKIEDVDMTIATYAGVKYKAEENKKKNKFEDLW